MSFTSFAKKAAPWITTIAGIAVPGAAPFLGIASKLLSSGLGSEVKADPQSISDAITSAMANPEQLAALKKIDDDFALQMKTLDIQSVEDLAKIGADDVANARNREIQVKDLTPRILAFTVVVLCFSAEAFYFIHGSASNAAPELVGRILGTLDSALMLVLAYYFGSSAGSARQTELLAKSPAVK